MVFIAVDRYFEIVFFFLRNLVIASTNEVMFSPVPVCLLVGRIYSRITQKLLKRFPTNTDGGSVLTTEKTPLTFGVNPDKGTYPGCFFSPYLTFLGGWYIWGRRLDLTRLFSLSFSCSSRFVWLRNQEYISTGCDAKRVYSYIHIFKFYSGVMMYFILWHMFMFWWRRGEVQERFEMLWKPLSSFLLDIKVNKHCENAVLLFFLMGLYLSSSAE